MEGKRMTSEKTSHPLNLVPARWQSGPAPAKEAAARAAIEARVGRPLSDREWVRDRARLLEFVSILRAWHQEGTISESELRKAAKIRKLRSRDPWSPAQQNPRRKTRRWEPRQAAWCGGRSEERRVGKECSSRGA